MLKITILCNNGDLIVIEPDHTAREVTGNPDALVVMLYRGGKIIHAVSESNLVDVGRTSNTWADMSGGIVAVTRTQV